MFDNDSCKWCGATVVRKFHQLHERWHEEMAGSLAPKVLEELELRGKI